MSKVAIEDTILDNIVDSVNKKTHGNDQMRPQDIPATVDGIKTEKPEQIKDYTITANGDTPIVPDPGKVITGGTIKVNVPTGGGGGGATVETVKVTINGNSRYEADLAYTSKNLEYVEQRYRSGTIEVAKNSIFVLISPMSIDSTDFRRPLSLGYTFIADKDGTIVYS